jgi:hypothetical protein
MSESLTRREMLGGVATMAVALAIPAPLARALGTARHGDPDHDRLAAWSATLRRDRLTGATTPLGRAAVRVGEQAAGTPYEASTLEAYLKAGGKPTTTEPLVLSLTRFDCVTLVESCLAIARAARSNRTPSWQQFGREVERMRYRNGTRGDYTTRNHYFSEWISDGARRGLVRDLGAELGGEEDSRPLRFMSEHRASYPALADDGAYRAIGEMERRLDGQVRHVIPTARIAAVVDRIQTGDVLAFATSIAGLDVSHSAMAYRDRDGVLRVLHAPLSGGVVEITKSTLPEYVARIKRATGILVARPA